METFNEIMKWINAMVWGSDEIILSPMMVLLLGVGLFLTIGLRFISITKISYGFRQLFKRRIGDAEEGDVSRFAALMTALSLSLIHI